MRIDIDKIVPLNCPIDKNDCIECGCFELAHDEVLCHYSNEENE